MSAHFPDLVFRTSIKCGRVKLVDGILLILTTYESLIRVLSLIINNDLFSLK